jgi:hypothetical protein
MASQLVIIECTDQFYTYSQALGLSISTVCRMKHLHNLKFCALAILIICWLTKQRLNQNMWAYLSFVSAQNPLA